MVGQNEAFAYQSAFEKIDKNCWYLLISFLYWLLILPILYLIIYCLYISSTNSESTYETNDTFSVTHQMFCCLHLRTKTYKFRFLNLLLLYVQMLPVGVFAISEKKLMPLSSLFKWRENGNLHSILQFNIKDFLKWMWIHLFFMSYVFTWHWRYQRIIDYQRIFKLSLHFPPVNLLCWPPMRTSSSFHIHVLISCLGVKRDVFILYYNILWSIGIVNIWLTLIAPSLGIVTVSFTIMNGELKYE